MVPQGEAELRAFLERAAARGAHGVAPSLGDLEGAPSRVGLALGVGAVAAGAVSAPSIVGALLFVALGVGWNGRGRLAFVLVGAAFGALSWLPTPDGLALRTLLALALAPLAFVPMLVGESAISVRRALAVSIDLALRCGRRERAALLALAAFFAWTPALLAGVELGPSHTPLDWPLTWIVRFAIAWPPAALAWWSVATLSRASHDPRAHHAPAARVGIAQVLVLALGLAWVGAVPAVVAEGPGSLLVSSPVGWARVGDGARIEMRRADGVRFEVLVHRETGRWWLDTIAPASIGPSHPYGIASSYADADVAIAHLLGVVCLVPFVLALALLVWARGGWLRRWLGRSSVVRARVRANAVVEKPLGAELPEGSEIVLTAEGATVRLARAVQVTALATLASDDAWVEVSIVSRDAWAADGGYRSVPRSPPPDARMVAGAPEQGLVASRLDDIERAVLCAMIGAPALALILGLAA